jgi:DNA-binding beta-propeller fold protein YncE
MRRFLLISAAIVPALVIISTAQQPVARTIASDGPYKVLKTVKAGGDGGFDYVFADDAGRKLYVPRSGQNARITVFNLDSLDSAGQIANVNGHGAAVDPKSGHGFASSKPVAMWDTKTLSLIKTIDVDGGPDGIMFDPYNARVWVFSHRAPNATIINAADGSIAGTLDLGGAPEQAATDGKGMMWVDIEDKDNIAVVDTKNLKVTGHYELEGKGGTCAGLALDPKNRILFASCRKPQNMVILNADSGKILDALPIGTGTDGAVFNANTMEAFSSQGDGTLTVIKENSPTSFLVEQNVQTMRGAKTLTLDSKTNHVLLIAAEYGPPPATPPPGGRGGRGQMLPDSFSIVVVGK